jgi:hypothetical protein
MAQFLTPAFLQAFDASAVPYASGSLYIYATGTTTELDLYSDEALTTPLANPIVADSAGVFAGAFLAETKFKAVLKDSDGVTIYTRDPVYSTGQADSVTADLVTFDGTDIGFSSTNVQDAIEEIDGTYAKLNNVAFTGTWSLTSTATDASSGPNLVLYRDSSSPAASDVIGSVDFYGEDSAGNQQLYSTVQSVITDPTTTSEDSKVVVQTSVAGTLADRLHVAAGAYMNGATGTDKGVGTINATAVYDDGVKLGITAATAQASTSGTSIDFTSIPAGVKRITIMFAGVSTSGTSIPLFQIGDSGGIEATSYSGSGSRLDGSPVSSNFTTGFGITDTWSSSATASGQIVLTLVNAAAFTWVAMGNFCDTSGNGHHQCGGFKSLSAELDRVRITTAGGSDTFDAGSINILYE